MAMIVGVHGVNQQLKGSAVLLDEWWPSLKDGVAAAGRTVADGALACAFYGGLFRAVETQRSGGAEPAYRAADVQDDFEKELLELWWDEAARAEPHRVVSPQAAVRGTPALVQSGLRALSRSTFFAGMAERALIGSLKQVRRYMREPAIRNAAQEAVDAVVSAETRILVAHSLGTVVAYEALHRYAGAEKWANVQTLVTLGSPLGIRNLIFDALLPAPDGGKGRWPVLIHRWTNISDDGDVVALQKRLGGLFSGDLVDMRIDNEARAHDVSPYLTSRATGAAIADGLA
jgi:hypothetical protein